MKQAYFYSIICILAALFSSCRTTRTVYRDRLVADSTAISALREDNRMLLDELARRSASTIDTQGVRIIFQTDTIQLPGTVTIDRSGVIAATGRLQEVQVSNRSHREVIEELRRTVDSLSSKDSSGTVRVVKEQVTVNKEVVRNVIPWWMWFALVGLAVWKAWPYIRKVVRI